MSLMYCLPFTVNDLADTRSRSFHVTQEGVELEGFVVRKGVHVYAYRNQCPHTGVPLNWSEHVFLDSHEELIQCAMHGALFTVEDGDCLRGPCQGESLQRLVLVIQDTGQIFVEIPPQSL